MRSCGVSLEADDPKWGVVVSGDVPIVLAVTWLTSTRGFGKTQNEGAVRAGVDVPAASTRRGPPIRTRRHPSGRMQLMPRRVSSDGVVISQEGMDVRARAGDLDFRFANSQAANILEAYETCSAQARQLFEQRWRSFVAPTLMR